MAHCLVAAITMCSALESRYKGGGVVCFALRNYGMTVALSNSCVLTRKLAWGWSLGTVHVIAAAIGTG